MLSKIVAAVLPCATLAGEHLFSVSVGRDTSFIVDKGVVQASGRNHYGQLGLGHTAVTHTFTKLPFHEEDNETLVKEIAAGAFHSLVLMENQDVYVTGRNHRGQLGDGSTDDTEGNLKKLNSIGRVKAVAAGYAHSVFLMEDGSVMSAGLNSHGQLGHGSTEAFTSTPGFVAPFTGATSKAYVLSSESTEDNATTAPTPAPTPAPLPKAKAIAAGYDFTYILSESGDVYAVGNGMGGQLGLGDRSDRSTAEICLTGVEQIAAGESHGLFFKNDGESIMGTGANFAGQLGHGSVASKFFLRPAAIFNARVQAIAAGGDSSCLSEFQLKCFGSNVFGQIGLGDMKIVHEPTTVNPIDLVDDMSLGDSHSIFLNHADVMVAGSNSHGQLGNNNTDVSFNSPRLYDTLQRGERTTTKQTTRPPIPTLPPIAGPTTAQPGPNPPRNPNSGGSRDWPWQMLVGGIAFGLGVVLIVVCILDRQQQPLAPRRSVAAPITVTQEQELQGQSMVV